MVEKGYTLDSSSFHFAIQTIYTNAFTDLVRSLSITAITTRLPDVISVTLSVYASGHEKVSSGILGSGTLADKTLAH